MKLTKSTATYLVSLAVMGLGWISPIAGEWLYPIGAYAVAGAITNGLAVHMLFEKVPLLYGSGVIQIRFESFKEAIKTLIMEQFFDNKTLEKHWSSVASQQLKEFASPELIARLPVEPLFDDLVATIQASSLGMMLQLAGGAAALEPLREPVVDKMRQSVGKILTNPDIAQMLQEGDSALVLGSGEISASLEKMIDARLDELTPKMVKEIVQKMIREHLGWLVVWGGVFGGVLGGAMTLIQPS